MSQAQRLQALKGPSAAGALNAPAAPKVAATPKASAGTTKSSTKSSTKKDTKNTLLAGLSYNTPLQQQRLNKCDWTDRLIYASRMLLGGNNVNGFLRGTATAQRIKKQRARQVGLTKKTAPTPTAPDPADPEKKQKAAFSQEGEEKLKKGKVLYAVCRFTLVSGLCSYTRV